MLKGYAKYDTIPERPVLRAHVVRHFQPDYLSKYLQFLYGQVYEFAVGRIGLIPGCQVLSQALNSLLVPKKI